MDKERFKNLKMAIKFLVDSIDENYGGSRAYFSRLYNPLYGWSSMYPETSGYIIPTFLKYSKRFDSDLARGKAIILADWLLSIQNSDGSFPGLLYTKNNQSKSIFNSAQIIIGLVSIYKYNGSKDYLDALLKCAKWIVENQNNDGSWSKYNYQFDYTPSYYTRVSWPILMASEISGDKNLKRAAIKTLQLIQNRKLDNAFIKSSGFDKNSYAYTHTIAYVIRGFLESSIILGNKEFKDSAIDWAEVLLRKFELNGKLPGAYYDNYKKIDYFECLTGYCQLAIIWLKIFKIENDYRYVNGALKALDRVSKFLPKSTFIKKKGGVPGSYPFYGKYMFMRQPNWATKFFIDAILLEEVVLNEIEKNIEL